MQNPPRNLVLLVEDDQNMLALLTRLLEIEGFDVMPVQSPTAESINDTLANQHPLAVVLDVYLSGQNGIDLLKSIREKKTTTPVRVMMTSGEDLSRECLSAGADGFLLKPYMPTDLIAWLRTQLIFINTKEK